jgi:hypothetical protein
MDILKATTFRSGYVQFFGANFTCAAMKVTTFHLPHTAAFGLVWGY